MRAIPLRIGKVRLHRPILGRWAASNLGREELPYTVRRAPEPDHKSRDWREHPIHYLLLMISTQWLSWQEAESSQGVDVLHTASMV